MENQDDKLIAVQVDGETISPDQPDNIKNYLIDNE